MTISEPAIAGITPTPPPPPPASAPATLTATGGNARVSLAWQAVGGATGYRIYRATDGVWGTTPIATVTGLVYTNSSLVNGTPYSYRVAGYTRGGNGPFSIDASATPMAPPLGLVATAGDHQVSLTWQPSAGALTYTVLRSLSTIETSFAPIATDVAATSFVDTGLINGTTYYYRVRAHAPGGTSGLSAKAYAKPVPPPPASAPANFAAKAGNARVTLTWEAVADATAYRIFRSSDAAPEWKLVAKVTTLTFKNTGLTNGVTYAYRVAANNMGGDGPSTDTATATPVAAPPAPSSVSATAGDRQVSIAWTAVPEATAYNLFRSTRSGRTGVAIASAMTATSYLDTNVENGPTYYYYVIATNDGGQSPRSPEASATPEGAASVVDPETTAAFRLLRQATWGPRPGDVDHVKEVGAETFLNEQFAAPASIYPTTLFDQPIEMAQEHFMHLALTGSDQLRQRVAWALHKIWVVSAVEVDSPGGIVTYHQALLNGAFGNYRDLMRTITLNPAMGSYLNMLNNRSELVTGVPANENYAREIMQLFTIGIPLLNPNGTPIVDASGAPVPAYTEADVKALARIFTGWTFGDGSASTIPRRLARENYRVPMEAVPAYHDVTEKMFLGRQFPAGQSASDDLEQALDTLFNHPNMAPFVSRQLIQQLVTSNPSPGYVADIAAVFSGSHGDIASVGTRRPDASGSGHHDGHVGQARRTSAVRGLDAPCVRRAGHRSPVHGGQDRGDGPEGLLPAVGVQLFLAGVPRARHGGTDRAASGRTRVPDPHVGHQPGARELRCLADCRLLRHQRHVRSDPVHVTGPRRGGAGGLLQPHVHGRPAHAHRAQSNHRRRQGDAGRERGRARADGALSHISHRRVAGGSIGQTIGGAGL